MNKKMGIDRDGVMESGESRGECGNAYVFGAGGGRRGERRRIYFLRQTMVLTSAYGEGKDEDEE